MDVFELQASIQLELDEFRDQLEKAKKDMEGMSKSTGGTASKIGSTIKNGIVSGAKAAAAGVAALATAITGLAVSSAKSFATFEQLSGGAQKIFDEIDYEKIAQDADNAYKDLNMSANEYLESINLVGATFAQTMGDEKGYDTARKGMLAISDYASGTGKNINELNQKFQMITRATSSYQSIADQFSGVLPATSADFLEQAQAAGLLSSEYEKLTQVPVAEYQEALTAMLEKGVNDLGLSQNTLRESTETMTGSLAMAKSAWENLKVAMAGGGNLDTAMQNFASSAGSAFKNLIPTFQAALKGVGTLIKELAPVISKELPGLLKTLVNDIGGTVLTVLPTLISTIGETLPVIANDLGGVIVSTFPTIISSILELAPILLETAAELLITLVTGLADALPTLIPQIVSITLKLVEILTSPEVLVGLVDAAIQLTIGLADGLIAAIPILLEQAPIIIRNFFQALTEAAPMLLEASVELIATLLAGIIENLPLILEGAVDIVMELLIGITNFSTTIWNKGQEIVLGIGSGIKDNLAEIGKAVGDVVDKVKSGIKVAIDGAKTWAKDMINNFVQGIKDNIYKIKEKASEMAQTVKDFIGFSEPEKGPLSNFHTYSPDMIDLFTKGIDDNQYKLINSVRGMAANVSANIQGNPQLSSGVSGGGYVTTSAPINVIFEINGIKNINELDFNEMSSRAVDALVNQLDKHGIAANRAKGGAGWR